MDSVEIVICSTPIRIVSNSKSFLSYADQHFRPVAGNIFDEPEIIVSLKYGDEGKRIKELESAYVKVCRGIYVNANEVLWNDIMYLPGLAIVFSFIGGVLQIDAFYKPRRSWKGKLKTGVMELTGRDDLKNRSYFELMYYLVYYPLFWLLKTKHVHFMHGGGISLDGGCIVIVGAQGTGKSTLLAHLMGQQKARLLSDNILMYDQERVYACYEPLRIDERMIELLPDIAEHIERMDLHVPLGRHAYIVKNNKCISSAIPDIFIIPRMSSRPGAITAISDSELVANVRCFNNLADEVRLFSVFDSVLCHLASEVRQGEGDEGALTRLVQGKRCYQLQLSYGDDPLVSAERILSVLV